MANNPPLQNGATEKVRLCLNMIVKDEEHIIADTLRSYAGEIDYYVICDTGSSDGTISKIRQTMDEFDIPGEIHEFEFRNFEYARNRALELARSSAAKFDYIIFGDADLPLEVTKSDWKSDLSTNTDCYLAKITTPRIDYYQVRLIGRHTPAQYVGVTHEKLICRKKRHRLESIRFQEQGTGASRKIKYERDIDLLRRALESEPDNARYVFYLGQSYFNLGQFESAIQAYRQRTGMAGNVEEVFYSLYRLGQCYEELNDWGSALDLYLQAYENRPSRAEPLFRIARHYRRQKNYRLGYMFARKAVETGYPRDDILFIRRDIYEYRLLEEYCVCAYQTGQYHESRTTASRLLHSKTLPAARRESIQKILTRCEAKTAKKPSTTAAAESSGSHKRIDACRRIAYEEARRQFLNMRQDEMYARQWTSRNLEKSTKEYEHWYQCKLPNHTLEHIRLARHSHGWIRGNGITGLILLNRMFARDVLATYLKGHKHNRQCECLKKIESLKLRILSNSATGPLFLVDDCEDAFSHLDGLHRIIAYNLLIQEGQSFPAPSAIIATNDRSFMENER